MKIRNCFVSNSSSSSFIVGYGVINIKKLSKLKKILENIDPDLYEITTVKERKNRVYNSYSLGFIDFEIRMNKMQDTDLLFTVDVANNEGDGCEFYPHGSYDSNYEKANNIDFYSKEQQKLILLLREGTFFDKNKPYEYQIGAKRNG